MTTAKREKSKFRKRDLFGWLVMLPTVVLFTFFVWEPLLENIRLSFCTAKMYTVTGFAGLENYYNVIHDVDFKAAFFNTFKYTFWSFLIGLFSHTNGSIPSFPRMMLSTPVGPGRKK